ncbi:hypothetical protein CRE_28731 [Caenorhabditis remanei]|uniref:Uncharacterized protein n=1 Tax=Caenorhabditis remanei TaxID=31234 RepID=E3MK83_CAERE|nr:hypothetical protein CRE_28731 [Caenorhabditis remanei]
MQNLEELHIVEAEDQDLEKNSTKVEKFPISTIIFTVIILFIAALFLFLGVTDYKTCPEDPRIYIWLNIVAILLFLERIISVTHVYTKVWFNNNCPEPTGMLVDKSVMKKWMKKHDQLNRRPLFPDLIWLVMVFL